MIIGEIIPQRTAPPKSLGRSLLAQPDHGKIDGMFVNPYQTTFAVQRGGVRTFDYSAKAGLVASGGTDRVVRFWSPWLKTHASFSLHGHETSVIGVNYMPDGVRLATLDVSRVVRIWDSKGQCGVSVITEGFHGITTDAYAIPSPHPPHPPPLRAHAPCAIAQLCVRAGLWVGREGPGHTTAARRAANAAAAETRVRWAAASRR